MHRTRKRTLVVLVSLTASCAAATGQTLAELTSVLARAQTIDDEAAGFAGGKSEAYRAYELWSILATPMELRELTGHESPNVRVYAVRALVEIRAQVDWKAIMLERLLDAAKITTYRGWAQQKVGNVIFTMLRPRLSDEEILDLAESMLQQDCPLDAREWALRSLRLRDGVVHVVRRLAKAGDGPAAIALARYGLATDAPILIEHLQGKEPFDRDTLLAAAIHRDPRLLAPLMALEAAAKERMAAENPSRLRFWLQAIAAQRSAEAAQFLLRFLRTACAEMPSREQDLLDTLDAVIVEPPGGVFSDVRAEVRKRTTRR